MALRVSDGDSPDKFVVSGRGELHLAVLIETMRREGYELGVSRPEVILKEENGQILEPFEQLSLDIEQVHQGTLMEKIGVRRGVLQNMQPDHNGRVRLDFMIPTRGLIGFRGEFLTLTSGTGLMASVFDHYGPKVNEELSGRHNGVLVSMVSGKSLALSLIHI